VTQTQLGFRESRDPYGVPWAPLKLRIGGKPLLHRGRLRSSITKSDVTASGFRLGSNLIYARVHQYGATIRPKRAKALRSRGDLYAGQRHTEPGSSPRRSSFRADNSFRRGGSAP